MRPQIHRRQLPARRRATVQRIQPALVNLKQIVWLPDVARAQGVRINGSSGSGKTVLASLIAYNDFQRGRPNIVLDPYGSLASGIIGHIWRGIRTRRLPADAWDRVVYADMSGRSGFVVPFPLLQRYGDEPLQMVADRLISAITRWDPELKTASIQGLNSIIKILTPASMILAALGEQWQVTEIPQLLHTVKERRDEWQHRFDQALVRDPSVLPAIQFFTEEYASWNKQTRERSIESLQVKLSPFLYNSVMAASFAAAQPGLNIEDVIANGKTVLLDFSGLRHEHKRFALLWCLWFAILEHFKHRGGGYHHASCGLMLDEISAYQSESPLARQLMADDLNELINILRRQYRLWLTVIHQESYQFDERVQQNLMSLGTQILGVSHDYESALAIARQFFTFRPQVRGWNRVWGTTSEGEHVVIDRQPHYYTLDEQHHMLAQLIQRQKLWKFLARIPEAEGGARGGLRQLDISKIVPEFVDEAIIDEMRQHLAAASGVPMQQVLNEIAMRGQADIDGLDESGIVPERAYSPSGYRIR